MLKVGSAVAAQPSPLEPILVAVVRFAGPLLVSLYLIQFSFRLGFKRRPDKCAHLPHRLFVIASAGFIC